MRLRTPSLVLALLVGSIPVRAQDPFAPGLRWTRAADPVRPWIPRSIAFGADDNVVITACTGGSPRLELLPAPSLGTNPPLLADAGVATSAGSLAVAGGSASSALFSVAQFPNPDSQHRRTVAQGRAATGASAWTYDAGFTTNGVARIACDAAGSSATLAAWDSATAQVQVDKLDGASGVRAWSVRVAGANFGALAVSSDGARTAIAAGLDLWVLRADGSVFQHLPLASSTQALAISGDGRRIAVGAIGSLVLLADGGAGYATLLQIGAPASEIATRAALSDDGGTLAIGWWDFTTGTALRFEAWDVASATRIVHVAQVGSAGGLQNFPECVRVTRDGRRIAFGSWGDGTSLPDVMLFDRAGGNPLLAVDLPGSTLGLALDLAGTRVAVATKDVHANQVGSTGAVLLYDTGERDLALLAQPHAGGTIDLAGKRAGATSCLFLVGERAAAPIQVAGASGSLLLRRAGLRWTARACDANGRADVSLPLADDATLLGTERHVQAAFRVGGVLVFGTTVVDPLIL